jgi:predicted nucleic-acid-binding Zn-ribbon protein
MKCPKCQEEMIKDEASIQGTLPGSFLVGLSHQHLWFKGPKGEKILSVESNGTVTAFRCDQCRYVLVKESSTLDKRMANAGKRLGGSLRKIFNRS